MTENPLSVAPLMKIALQVTLTAGESSSAPPTRSLPMQFIWGIGKEGLSPFENALHGKIVGDRLTLNVSAGELPVLLGHLCAFLPDVRPWRACAGHVEIVITTIAPADGREVIKALAVLTEGCGDGCECGCGC